MFVVAIEHVSLGIFFYGAIVAFERARGREQEKHIAQQRLHGNAVMHYTAPKVVFRALQIETSVRARGESFLFARARPVSSVELVKSYTPQFELISATGVAIDGNMHHHCFRALNLSDAAEFHAIREAAGQIIATGSRAHVAGG